MAQTVEVLVGVPLRHHHGMIRGCTQHVSVHGVFFDMRRSIFDVCYSIFDVQNSRFDVRYSIFMLAMALSLTSRQDDVRNVYLIYS